METKELKLNEKGQCPFCLVKPLIYKRKKYFFCCRCSRNFDLSTGIMIASYAWNADNTPTKLKIDAENATTQANEIRAAMKGELWQMYHVIELYFVEKTKVEKLLTEQREKDREEFIKDLEEGHRLGWCLGHNEEMFNKLHNVEKEWEQLKLKFKPN